MYTFIIPDEMLNHPKNKNCICETLEAFFEADKSNSTERELRRLAVMDVLEDEPELLGMFEEELAK